MKAFELPYLMDDPVKSLSLKEFWGKRWDTVLQSLLKEYVYIPLRKKYDMNRTLASFITFFCSGLGHTLPISNGLGDLNMMFAMLLYFLIEFILLCLQDIFFSEKDYKKPIVSMSRKNITWAITMFLVLIPAPLFLIPALCLSKWCPSLSSSSSNGNNNNNLNLYNNEGLNVLYSYAFWCIYTILTILLICIVGIVRYIGYISSHVVEWSQSNNFSLYAYAMFSAFGIGNIIASCLTFFLGQKILKNGKSRETFMPKLTNTNEVFQLSIFFISVIYLLGFGGVGIGVIVDEEEDYVEGKTLLKKKKKKQM